MKTLSLFCCSLILLLSGCTALLWGENRVADSSIKQITQFSDNITGVFHYKNLAVSAIQKQQKSSLAIPSEGIAFTGEKNIYFLQEGASQLLELDRLSTRIPLAVGLHRQEVIRLQLKPVKEKNAVMQFSDVLLVRVDKGYAALSEEDLNIITQSGFVPDGGKYIKQIALNGVIIPKDNLNYAFTQKTSLEKTRPIEFYSRERTTDLHPLNLATNIVFTPLTVAADIIFFPVSIRVLGLISNPPTH